MNVKKLDVVGAAIYDSFNKRILVTMRDKGRHRGGLWEFPGGKIEPGESNEEALVREIEEELNCIIKVGRLLEDYTYDYPEFTVRLLTYLCTLKDGEPELTEHEGMKWVSREEMQQLKYPEADLPTVKMLSDMEELW